MTNFRNSAKRCSPQIEREQLFCAGLGRGFSLVEVLIVVVILAITAAVVIPGMSSAASTKIRSAADVIASDLEYARSMAITNQRAYTVDFDTSAESYQLEDNSGVIEHPVKKGFDFVVDFSGDSRLSRVDIYTADFGGSDEVSFDYLGSCDNGGVVTLKAGDVTVYVNVQSVTGFITVTD